MIRGVMLLLAVLTLTLGGPAWAADLDGTLKKIKDTNTIRLGYREASRPFSFTGDDGKPAGYSVDLCTAVAASIAKQLALPNLQTTWVKVTVANRMEEIVKGAIDLECGSTTASLSRQEQVDFSLLTFLDGGSLLVTDAGGVKDVRHAREQAGRGHSRHDHREEPGRGAQAQRGHRDDRAREGPRHGRGRAGRWEG